MKNLVTNMVKKYTEKVEKSGLVSELMDLIRACPSIFAVLSHLRLSAPSKVMAPGVESAWSLPPGITCPGATPVCSRACYAARGRHSIQTVQRAHVRNWVVTQHALDTGQGDRWVDAMVSLIRFSPAGIAGLFRIHESGDFYSQQYLDLWVKIVKKLPNIRFWAYTRSFDLDFSGLLALENFRLWVSIDTDNENEAFQFLAGCQGLKCTKNPVRLAQMGEPFWDDPKKSFLCPESQGTFPSCAACGLCFSPRLKRSVVFPLHG